MNREQLLFNKLAEECSEVAKVALKAAQFGMDDVFCGESNSKRVNSELNDLLAIVEMLNEEFNLGFSRDEEAISRKKEKVNKYADYSRKNGFVA